MHISVHVRSGDPAVGDLAMTTHCLIVFVRLDPDGRAVPARQWEPVSAEDVALDGHAQHLIALRATASTPISRPHPPGPLAHPAPARAPGPARASRPRPRTRPPARPGPARASRPRSRIPGPARAQGGVLVGPVR